MTRCAAPLVYTTRASSMVLSQSSIFGQNPKIWCQEFNDLQTPKCSKKQLCDRTLRVPWCLTEEGVCIAYASASVQPIKPEEHPEFPKNEGVARSRRFSFGGRQESCSQSVSRPP